MVGYTVETEQTQGDVTGCVCVWWVLGEGLPLVKAPPWLPAAHHGLWVACEVMENGPVCDSLHNHFPTLEKGHPKLSQTASLHC